MQVDFDKAVETLEILVTALGAGISMWGTINLMEAYQDEADKEDIAGEYRSRISEIDWLFEQICSDRDSGKITLSQYQKLTTLYEAEQDELTRDLYGLDKAIAAQKERSIKQIMQGASVAAIAPDIYRIALTAADNPAL